MRRPTALLSLLAAAAILVLGTAGPAGAGAAPRSARIACQTAGAHILPCCPVPLQPQPADAPPICCGQTTCCTGGATDCCLNGSILCCTQAPCTAGSLTIASSPNPSIAGRKVVISGGFVGNPVAGANVALWRRGAGQTSFKEVAQTTTDSAGRYTFTLKGGTVMTDQAWYVTSRGSRSATLTQHVKALVGLRSSARSATVGQAVVLRGSVTPSHAGQTVLIEQSRGTAWHVIARIRLGKSSSYALSHRFRQPGAVKLRSVLPGDARNDTSVSRSVTLTVKP